MMSVDELALLLSSKADYSLEVVISWNPNDEWSLSQVFLSRRNRLASARFEPATPSTGASTLPLS